MVAELVVCSVQAYSADLPNLLKEECKIVKFDNGKITDVAVRSGDRSMIRVKILQENYQGDVEAKTAGRYERKRKSTKMRLRPKTVERFEAETASAERCVHQENEHRQELDAIGENDRINEKSEFSQLG